MPVPMVDLTEGRGGPVRCTRCKGYVNPFRSGSTTAAVALQPLPHDANTPHHSIAAHWTVPVFAWTRIVAQSCRVVP